MSSPQKKESKHFNPLEHKFFQLRNTNYSKLCNDADQNPYLFHENDEKLLIKDQLQSKIKMILQDITFEPQQNDDHHTKRKTINQNLICQNQYFFFHHESRLNEKADIPKNNILKLNTSKKKRDLTYDAYFNNPDIKELNLEKKNLQCNTEVSRDMTFQKVKQEYGRSNSPDIYPPPIRKLSKSKIKKGFNIIKKQKIELNYALISPQVLCLKPKSSIDQTSLDVQPLSSVRSTRLIKIVKPHNEDQDANQTIQFDHHSRNQAIKILEKYSHTKQNEQKKQAPSPIMHYTNNYAGDFDKKELFEKRLALYQDFIFNIQLSQRIIILPDQQFQPYKAYIAIGNNGNLVRQLFKNRWWWIVDDQSDENTNLYFTQWRKTSFLKKLKNANQDKQLFQKLEKIDIIQYELKKHILLKVDFYSKAKNTSLERNNKSLHFNQLYLETDQICANTKNNNSDYFCRKVPFKDFLNRSKIPDLNCHEATQDLKLHNHLESNFHLSNKKALFYNLKYYYESIGVKPFDRIPLTYHIQNNVVMDPEFLKFKESFLEIQNKKKNTKNTNVWIIKPGESTNRGKGIQISDNFEDIRRMVCQKEFHNNGGRKTYIIQKYIVKPFLYCKRKFDIRCYILVTNLNGHLKGYWYQDGYIRTSSSEFTLKKLENKLIHLTNDAIQKKSDKYGKFENGNKLLKISYSDFQKYLNENNLPFNFQSQAYPKLKQMALDAIESVQSKIDANKRMYSFELFGLDFMIDSKFRPWLIEINTNPCLEQSSPILGRLISSLVENVIKIAVDPIFPPPYIWARSKWHLVPDNTYESNKFELVFDELHQNPNLQKVDHKQLSQQQMFIDDEDEVYDDD